ncbi:glycosyltransferase family 2 protein [Candidatus Woesearchaeota archaeon]|nr:glycosyltransferase family 2 protein [Candidatus Woesearchaeota archaeon]
MVWVVIAAYNEEANIAKVVSSLLSFGYKNVIVVDDGSRDNTFKEAENSGAIVLIHSINRGQGAALQTGVEHALEQGADIIVTFDADGQHRIEDIKAVVAPIKEGSADVVFGSRFLGHSKVPLLRRLLLFGSIFVVWVFYRVRMTDAHNGFRAFSRKAAIGLNILSDRMGHASEIVDWVKKNNLRFVEVPVVVKYSHSRKGHGSYAQALKVLFDMLWRKLFQ